MRLQLSVPAYNLGNLWRRRVECRGDSLGVGISSETVGAGPCARPAARLPLSFLCDSPLVLPQRIKSWSLTSFEQRLMKSGGRLVKHARYYWLLLTEGHLNRRLFGDMLHRIWALPLSG